MRKLLRQIAHANMKRQGIQHPNKQLKGYANGASYSSFFANHWREWAKKTPTRPLTASRMI